MEVLTSKNRMSTTTFLSLNFTKMSLSHYYPDFNGPAATQHSEDSFSTYCLTSIFIVFCVFPLFMYFKDSILWTFSCIGDSIHHISLYITFIFKALFGLYTIWKELKQLQPQDQCFQQPRTRKALIQIPPLLDEFLTEVREQFHLQNRHHPFKKFNRNAVTLRYLRQNDNFCTLLAYS